MIVQVRGLRYYKFKMPAQGEQVIIVFEPFNKFDDKALAVYNGTTGEKIGYIGREWNYRVKDQMRAALCYGKVFMSASHQFLIEILSPSKKPSPKKSKR